MTRIGPLRVGVIGLGTIAQAQHLPSLAAVGDRFRITAVADGSARRLAAVAGRLPGTVFAPTDWREVCRHPRVDAVLLLAPGAHRKPTQEALSAGKHVFSEPPLALTVAGIKRLSALAAHHNLVLQMGYMKLHEQAFDALAAAWDTIGEHRLIRHTVYQPGPSNKFADLEVLSFDDGDREALAENEADELDQAYEALGRLPSEWIRLYRGLVGAVIHTASILRSTMGMLPPISAARMWPPSPPRPPTTPPCLSIVAHPADYCRVEVNWLWLPDFPQYRERLGVHGHRGSLEMSFPSPYRPDGVASLVKRSQKAVTRHPATGETALVRQLRAFHSAIITGNRPPDAWRSAADLAWVQAALGKLAEESGVQVAGEAVNYSQPDRFPLLHSAQADSV